MSGFQKNSAKSSLSNVRMHEKNQSDPFKCPLIAASEKEPLADVWNVQMH